MSSLTPKEKAKFEKLLDMGGGYVANFSDATLGTLVGDTVERDIHDERYCGNGKSKAKKLREFWRLEDDVLIAELLDALIDERSEYEKDGDLIEACRVVVRRLRSGSPRLAPLAEQAIMLNAPHLAKAIERMEKSIHDDPAHAIGSAKELVETTCKEILAARDKTFGSSDDLPQLTKATFKVLELLPDGVPDQRRGSDVIKRILQNLSTVGQGLGELRNLYGTGHGRHGTAGGLQPRHAMLAAGAASTLANFLIDTHNATKP